MRFFALPQHISDPTTDAQRRDMRLRSDILIAALVFTGVTLLRPIIAGSTDSPDGEAAVFNPFADRADMASEGKTLFNVHCSHCHGPNAVQGEKRRDLRRLRGRYGEQLPAVFIETASNGRPDRGMPAWEDVVEKEQLWKIFTFLETVQKK
jgi:mono/diheme cytochrome c family protein